MPVSPDPVVPVRRRRALVVATFFIASGLAVTATAAPDPAGVARTAELSGLPRASVIAVTPDMGVAIRSRGGTTGGFIIHGVELQGEVLDETSAQTFGYRSMRSLVDIDCARGRDLVTRLEVYPQHDLKGAPEVRRVPGGWAQPKPEAYLARVLEEICKGQRVGPVELRPAPPPPPPVASSRPAKAADPEVARPAPAGGVAVQIGAGGDEAGARKLIRNLKTPLPPGAAGDIQTITVEGRPVYRALIRGFASRAEAGSFCSEVVRAGGACFIR